MDYPLEKYKFIHSGNKVIALSTDAGKTIRGTATCAKGDEFNLEFGKKLAAARCAEKIARRRYKRAWNKYVEAHEAFKKATVRDYMKKSYYKEASAKYNRAIMEICNLLKEN